jgi:hypothetical protein
MNITKAVERFAVKSDLEKAQYLIGAMIGHLSHYRKLL